jgi:hypothetical protein
MVPEVSTNRMPSAALVKISLKIWDDDSGLLIIHGNIRTCRHDKNQKYVLTGVNLPGVTGV